MRQEDELLAVQVQFGLNITAPIGLDKLRLLENVLEHSVTRTICQMLRLSPQTSER